MSRVAGSYVSRSLSGDVDLLILPSHLVCFKPLASFLLLLKSGRQVPCRVVLLLRPGSSISLGPRRTWTVTVAARQSSFITLPGWRA